MLFFLVFLTPLHPSNSRNFAKNKFHILQKMFQQIHAIPVNFRENLDEKTLASKKKNLTVSKKKKVRLSFRKRVLRHVVGRAWVPLKDEALYLAFRVILREPDSGHKAVVFPPGWS